MYRYPPGGGSCVVRSSGWASKVPLSWSGPAARGPSAAADFVGGCGCSATRRSSSQATRRPGRNPPGGDRADRARRRRSASLPVQLADALEMRAQDLLPADDHPLLERDSQGNLAGAADGADQPGRRSATTRPGRPSRPRPTPRLGRVGPRVGVDDDPGDRATLLHRPVRPIRAVSTRTRQRQLDVLFGVRPSSWPIRRTIASCRSSPGPGSPQQVLVHTPGQVLCPAPAG